ncbi:LysM peptidoglycan-binding domain-containing protein [Phycisphaera mikurensis]|uniref:LysM domain-containing protein n=1 Tax=Phycisphaera mikurensis (strain NBRC 102666 / KCTC 22515 / FYK2301M01) TaxID=1142394 RepID=I0IGB9_PHYMF|nr:LysM peptidoglycan-binding domain-containing protein [Phycisphaera mikurensis]MBB6440314.1 nucleoid-associated protein YgaU [Phycisphaera mikurensis]BAM04307.1 hypothetical protein PSMK_21480 [Phycisphaera mikurensis NBRC 102666]
MARDTKVGMLLGLGIILLVGIFVSDHLRPAQEPPQQAAAGFAGAAMDRGQPAGESDAPAGGAAEVGFIPMGPPTPPPAGGGVASATTAFAAPLPAFRPETPAAGADEPLLVPRVAGPAVPAPALGGRGGERVLLVRTGDTLEQIAFELYGATGYAEALAVANPGAVDINGRLVAGSRLIVPDYAGAVPPGVAAAPPPPAPAAAAVVLPPPPAPELRAAPTPAETAAAEVRVEVRPGDSLSRLAARHLDDARRFEELYEANRDVLSSPDAVQAGMTLRLPAGETGRGVSASVAAAASPPRVAAPPATASVGGVGLYTVQPGDSLSRIASRVLGDPNRWNELYEANRDTLGSPDSVVVGQELRVPG